MLNWQMTPEGCATGWTLEDMVGLVSCMLSEADPRSAVEQLDTGYQHGWGWRPFVSFKFRKDYGLSYPGDPTMWPLAWAALREERIYAYPHAWFCVAQPDGSFKVARMG